MGKYENELESTSDNTGGFVTQVVLNVYDLTPFNHYTYCFGFGIFHSGIEVHGIEYGFGAHEFSISGVFEMEPRSGPGFIYRCSVPLAQIIMPPSELQTLIESVASEYHRDTYDLITKYCNHFTDDIAYRLTGKRIPGWVYRLARMGALCSCLLPEGLQVTTAKEFSDYHECIEDGTELLSMESHQDHTEREADDAQQEKALISPKSGNSDISFIKETEIW